MCSRAEPVTGLGWQGRAKGGADWAPPRLERGGGCWMSQEQGMLSLVLGSASSGKMMRPSTRQASCSHSALHYSSIIISCTA